MDKFGDRPEVLASSQLLASTQRPVLFLYFVLPPNHSSFNSGYNSINKCSLRSKSEAEPIELACRLN
jgi:hypothetical protein